MNKTQVYVNPKNGDKKNKMKKANTVMGKYSNREMIFELLYCT